ANFWRYSNNPGYDTSFHGGRIICDGCYKEFKEAVDSHNHLTEGGGSNCSDRNCVLHSNNSRFVFRTHREANVLSGNPDAGNWCAIAWKDKDYYGRYLKDGWGMSIAGD